MKGREEGRADLDDADGLHELGDELHARIGRGLALTEDAKHLLACERGVRYNIR